MAEIQVALHKSKQDQSEREDEFDNQKAWVSEGTCNKTYTTVVSKW